MSKAVLISIHPKWCELIAHGKKTVEVRKTKPKLETPFKVYIYCTQGDSLNYLKNSKHGSFGKFWVDNNAFGFNVTRANGKVIGEFVCDRIYNIPFLIFDSDDEWHPMFFGFNSMACLADYEIDNYLGKKDGYGWHISDLVIYDKPKELSEFKPYNRTEDDCKYSHLGYAIPKCSDCHECYVKRPPQSWCYVEADNG